MNAGIDDGVPASVLRELNYLNYLKDEPVQNLVSVELKNRFVIIQQEYINESLRDYLQNSSPIDAGIHSRSKVCSKSAYQVKQLTFGLIKAL